MVIYLKTKLYYPNIYLMKKFLFTLFFLGYSLCSVYAQFDNHINRLVYMENRKAGDRLRKYSDPSVVDNDTEIGINIGVAAPFVEIGYRILDSNGVLIKDGEAIGKLKPIFYYGFTYGENIRIAKLSKTSALGLNISLVLNYTKGSFSNEDFKINSQYDVHIQEDFKIYRWYLPIGLDYKWGAEAAENKYLKSMYTLGFGVAPNLISYTIIGAAGVPQLSPYAKVEFGGYFGMAFKLRLLYLFREQVWDFTDSPKTKSDLSIYRLTTPGEFSVALIVMPLSVGWE